MTITNTHFGFSIIKCILLLTFIIFKYWFHKALLVTGEIMSEETDVLLKLQLQDK